MIVPPNEPYTAPPFAFVALHSLNVLCVMLRMGPSPYTAPPPACHTTRVQHHTTSKCTIEQCHQHSHTTPPIHCHDNPLLICMCYMSTCSLPALRRLTCPSALHSTNELCMMARFPMYAYTAPPAPCHTTSIQQHTTSKCTIE